MPNFIEYEIIEHYRDADSAPEPFGFQMFPVTSPPRVGDVVMLRWLDGKDAYRVQVERVSGYVLHVRAT